MGGWSEESKGNEQVIPLFDKIKSGGPPHLRFDREPNGRF